MSTPYDKIHVIINPAAGKEGAVLKPLNTAFQEMGLEWEVSITKAAGDARRFAEQAVAAGVDVVASYGGDGTVLEVASGLIGSRVPLLILPGGTANVVSIELGLPRALSDVLALLSAPDTVERAIDMGQIGDKLFFHMGIGFEAQMITDADREEKNRSGLWAYINAALKNLRNPTVAHYALLIDGEHVEVEGINCMVTNLGSLGVGGLKLSKTIDISDGLMDVIIIQDVKVSTMLSAATAAVVSGDMAAPLLQWQAREVTVVADPPQSITCDGELVEIDDIKACILPGAIHVLVPGPKG